MPADPPEPDDAPQHGDFDPGTPGWTGPPDPTGKREIDRPQNNDTPQEWAAPPEQESPPDSPTTGPEPPRFTRVTGLILCIGGTLYTLLLAGLLTIATVLIMFGAAAGASVLVLSTPVATLIFGALGFWGFRKVFDHTEVPAATGVTVLFTVTAMTSVTQATVLFYLTPVTYGYHPIAPAGMIAFVVAITLLLTRGRRLWWATLVLLLAIIVRGLVEWWLSAAEYDHLFTETEDAFAAHPYDVAVLDMPEWESYRAEITQAQHPDRGHVDVVFTTYLRNESGARLRITTWADEETRRDPEQVLRGWCDEDGAVCEEYETTGGHPVVLLYEPGAGPAPQSARVEYAPGTVAFLGPWTETVPGLPADEADVSAHVDIDKDLLLEMAEHLHTVDDGELAELSQLTTEFALDQRQAGE